jgi:hypothetical protein
MILWDGCVGTLPTMVRIPMLLRCLQSARRTPRQFAPSFTSRGELSATAALRRLFPGLDAETARECTRAIAGWEPQFGRRLCPARLHPDIELPGETHHDEDTSIQNTAGPRTPRP